MKISRILDLEEIRSVEPTFSDLTEDLHTRLLLQEEAEEARLVVDEHEQPLALALHTGDGWKIAHLLFRKASLEVLDRFEQTGGEIYQEARQSYLLAVREYYSQELMDRVTPAVEDITKERLMLVQEILEGRWGKRSGEDCLDCCCGSGIGSCAIRSLGMTSIAYDNDPALLSLGLKQRRLFPEFTMWIDATQASRYCTPVPRGVAFMLGEIHPYHAEMWRQVVEELITLAEEVIITAGTEQEARIVAEWCRDHGRMVQVEEHPGDPIYERWICQISRSGK
jgi:hypothetical protein